MTEPNIIELIKELWKEREYIGVPDKTAIDCYKFHKLWVLAQTAIPLNVVQTHHKGRTGDYYGGMSRPGDVFFAPAKEQFIEEQIMEEVSEAATEQYSTSDGYLVITVDKLRSILKAALGEESND